MELVYRSTTVHSVQLFAVRHLSLFTIVALSIYWLRFSETVQLQPSWRKFIDRELYHNGRYPGRETEYLPRPVITDLKSGSSVEVIIITNSLHLDVLITDDASSKKHGALPPLKAVSSTPILSPTGGAASLPVAMTTGYLQSFGESTFPKKVILLILSDWSVLCYDHSLTLLWHQSNWTEEWSGQLIVDAAIELTSVAVDKRDNGTVIVSISYMDGAKISQPNERTESMEQRSKFIILALGGTTGEVRWLHWMDGRKQQQRKQARASLQHWKLGVQPVHVDGSDWSEYRDIIFTQMPHEWFRQGDSRLSLVSLKHSDDEVLRSPLDEWLHAYTQPTAPPPPTADAISLSHKHGVTLFSLHTGTPLCTLHLPSSSVYVDLDGDGRLDTVKADMESCTGSANQVHSERRILWQVPICSGATWWTWLTSSTKSDNPDPRHALPPIVVKRVPRSGQLAHHLLAISDTNQHLYDSIFVTSAGVVTSYGPYGELNWQVLVPADWPISVTNENAQLYDFYTNAFQPSIVVMETGRRQQRYLLVSGWSQMAVVDVANGRLLASHSLPCHPIRKPVTGDVNGDGMPDVMIHCPEGYIVFTLHSRSNYRSVALSAAVVAAVILLSYCCKTDNKS